jgi:hypothetical protein
VPLQAMFCRLRLAKEQKLATLYIYNYFSTNYGPTALPQNLV